jgi:hypothetical protein
MTPVNNALKSIFNDLVEKRLWPVALALGVALIAIPVLLSNPPDSEPASAPVVPAAPATGSGGALSAFHPVVNSEGKKSSEIRKSLKGFQSKDPFEIPNLGGGGGGDTGTVEVQDAGTTSDAGAGGGAGGTGGGSLAPDPGPTTSPGDSGTAPSGSGTSQLTYFTYTVDVRFGKPDNLDKKRLEQFRALPSSQDPVIVFMGVREDGETAVFLVSSASSTTGEGDCEPDDTCTFLYMKAGDQQTFEAVDPDNKVVTYVLKLVDVNVEETDGPDNASSSSRRAARKVARDRRERFTRRVQAIGF